MGGGKEVGSEGGIGKGGVGGGKWVDIKESGS